MSRKQSVLLQKLDRIAVGKSEAHNGKRYGRLVDSRGFLGRNEQALVGQSEAKADALWACAVQVQ